MSAPPPERAVVRRLLTTDSVRIEASLRVPGSGGPGRGETGIVLAHGFAATARSRPNRRIVARLARQLPVIAFDFRGHGRSGGACTLGDREVNDVAAAVAWGRTLGWRRIVTVGFSMGAAIAVRHAGLIGDVAGVVAISGPAFWNYRGTPVMRRLHFGVEHPVGRQFVRRVMRTRVIEPPWPTPWPTPPQDAAALIPPIPFLVVHGRADPFFPEEHPRALIRAARTGAAERGLVDYRPELWLSDFGHAEAAIPDALVDRVAHWALQC